MSWNKIQNKIVMNVQSIMADVHINALILPAHLYANVTRVINCMKIKEIAKKKKCVQANYESQNNRQNWNHLVLTTGKRSPKIWPHRVLHLILHSVLYLIWFMIYSIYDSIYRYVHFMIGRLEQVKSEKGRPWVNEGWTLKKSIQVPGQLWMAFVNSTGASN